MSDPNHGPGPLEPVKRYLVKGLASGIGLASEGITSYKERKRLRKAGLSPDSTSPSHTPTSPRASDDDLPTTRQLATPPLSDHEKDDDFKDEKLWKLDEAQDQLSPPPYTERATTPNGSRSTSPSVEAVEKFLHDYPAPEYETSAKLSQPVILPQKRPKTRSRGFIRAYAPSLGPCGISQDMFLDFITTFDTSTQSSPWLDAINLASIGLSFIPHFPMLVGIAIQVSISAAKDVQSRTRTNSFLDKANSQIFMPRGLYCLIMTYSPEDDNEAPHLPGTNVSSAIISKANSTGLQKFQNRFREASGHACEAEIPESAPLVFPGLGQDLTPEDVEESKNAKEKMKKAQKYITDYYDKRAQAKFAGKHAGSSLVKGPEVKFTSRFADPNHPAASGSFRSLITGGYITPPDMGRSRSRSSERMEERREYGRDEYSRGRYGDLYGRYGFGRDEGWENRQSSSNAPAPHAPYGGQSRSHTPSMASGRSPSRNQDLIRLGPVGLPTPGTLVKKALKKNILYMMVVNMPSDEELALAAEHLQQSRSKGINMSDFITHLHGH